MSKALGAAIRAGRDRKGMTAAAVGSHFGITGPAISQWESGKTEPSFVRLQAVAELLDLDLAELVRLSEQPDVREEFAGRTALPAPQESSVRPAPEAPAFSSVQGYARDVPVYGTAVGGPDGDFRLNGNEVDRAIRPPGLLNVKGLFALYATNDSMYPAWRDGALFYINPNRRPVVGDDVVIEFPPAEDGTPGKAYLKRLKARSGGSIIVEQFNPPAELTFPADKVTLYRVIPWEEALGLS